MDSKKKKKVVDCYDRWAYVWPAKYNKNILLPLLQSLQRPDCKIRGDNQAVILAMIPLWLRDLHRQGISGSRMQSKNRLGRDIWGIRICWGLGKRGLADRVLGVLETIA